METNSMRMWLVETVIFLLCSLMIDAQSLDDLLAAAPTSPYTFTDWEQKLVMAGLPPGPDPQFMTAEDGLELAYREYVPDQWVGSGDAVLLIPGSSAHSGQLVPLCEGLVTRGVFVRAIDTRGHGYSIRDRDGNSGQEADRSITDDAEYYVGRIGDCLDPNQMVRDVKKHLEAMRTAWPDARIHLGGHSSGGGCLSRFAEVFGGELVDSFVLIAPFNHFQQPQNIQHTNSSYSIVSPTAIGKAAGGQPHLYVLGFNLPGRDTAEAREATRLLIDRWTFPMMQGMAATSPNSFWEGFTKPVLWIAGEKDELFDIEICRQQHARAKAGGEFVVIENTSHLGLQWSDEVAKEIVDALREQN